MSEDIFLDTFGGGFGLDETLASWVMNKCNDWRDHYEANYRDRHEEYMRAVPQPVGGRGQVARE